jgi:peptidoglycan/xylan/chitin deacetylase (PgdA/CDA1 family)
VLTQTLHVIDDMAAALGEAHRILKPGGVLLATFPAASRVCLEYGPDGDFWRLTPAGARALAGGVFGHAEVSIDVRGNALTNVAFLEGLGAGELAPDEYDVVDPYYPALTGVRARKATGRKRARARGVVLLYHRVAAGPDAHGLAVPPDVFEAHLAWLSRACDIVPLDVLLSSEAGTLPARAVSLTFDDGYVDNLEVAAPLLARAGIPATFFLTTAHLDSRGEYWWDTLERILLGGREVPPRLRLAIDGSSREFPTGSAEDRAAAHWEIHRGLVRAGLDARRQAIDGLRAWAGDARTGAGPMVADEVHSLAGMPGVTVGAHGVHHLALPSQPPDIRAREIDGSRAALARLTGRPVDLFAYPYGDTSWDAAGDVRSRGLWGVTCVASRLEESFDAAQAPRLDVKPWSAEDLAARVERLLDGAPVGPGAVSLGP